MLRRLRFSKVGRLLSFFLVGVLLSGAIALLMVGCSRVDREASLAGSPPQPEIEMTLVSFAVTRAAYEKIIPMFADQWKREHNQNVIIYESYGGSGAQTRAVMDGLNADVVALALALDVKKLEKVGLINQGWEEKLPNHSVPHTSVVALVTRQGNPQNIRTWEDLTQPGLQVVTANPKTSGGARWNFLALWGAITQTGGTDAQAMDYTTQVFKNVPVLTRDARESTDAFFKQGQGDVLLNYENEVILAGLNGIDLSYVVPDPNISIDNPVAVVDANVDKNGTREVAEAFLQFLFTPAAQAEFAKVGFRPVLPEVAQDFATQFPPVNTLFTVEDLGGWSTIQEKFFADDAVFDQIQSKLGKG